MGGWILAAPEHSELLRLFTCVEAFSPLAVYGGRWSDKKHDKPWARKIDGMVHGIAGKYKEAGENRRMVSALPPFQIRLSDDGSRIDGLFSYYTAPGPTLADFRLHLAIFARHRDCEGQGIGAAALSEFEERAQMMADAYPTHGRIFHTAEVHTGNIPAQRAVRSAGWSIAEDLTANDTQYEPWIKVVERHRPAQL